MSEKFVFRVTIVPSVLFLVSRFCTPPEVKFDAFGTSKHEEGKSLSKNFFLLYLSVRWGDLIEQIKKICPIHFKYLGIVLDDSLTWKHHARYVISSGVGKRVAVLGRLRKNQ